MPSIDHQSVNSIWLIEHSSDNVWLLQLLLENWGYQVTRIKDSEALRIEINSQTVKPNLVILSIAPLQKNALEIVKRFRQDSVFDDIPLLCLCTHGVLCKSQVMAAGANDVLDKPFELEELQNKLQRLLAIESNNRHLKSGEGKTLLVLEDEEDESSSLIQQQKYWTEVLQQQSEPNAWELLAEAGYEVNVTG